jgi:hypothetical protein
LMLETPRREMEGKSSKRNGKRLVCFEDQCCSPGHLFWGLSELVKRWPSDYIDERPYFWRKQVTHAAITHAGKPTSDRPFCLKTQLPTDHDGRKIWAQYFPTEWSTVTTDHPAAVPRAALCAVTVKCGPISSVSRNQFRSDVRLTIVGTGRNLPKGMCDQPDVLRPNCPYLPSPIGRKFDHV